MSKLKHTVWVRHILETSAVSNINCNNRDAVYTLFHYLLTPLARVLASSEARCQCQQPQVAPDLLESAHILPNERGAQPYLSTAISSFYSQITSSHSEHIISLVNVQGTSKISLSLMLISICWIWCVWLLFNQKTIMRTNLYNWWKLFTTGNSLSGGLFRTLRPVTALAFGHGSHSLTFSRNRSSSVEMHMDCNWAAGSSALTNSALAWGLNSVLAASGQLHFCFLKPFLV